jgi:hypothetical protein
MSIVGQNSLLNQYVPTVYIKDLLDGRTLRYDSVRRAFINATGGGGSGATRLGELDDVSSSVDNPLSLQNGQSLVYNSFTSLWENQFILPDQTGNAGRFLTTNGSVLSWGTISGTGTVTTVSVTTANGVSGVVANPTTTPAITLTLGAITPTSVTAVGPVTGSNLSGTNTGNQVITLTGDATNSNTSTGGILTLATVNANVGTFGSSTLVPVVTVDGKGRITSISTTAIAGGGTVTSVATTGNDGITVAGSPITTSGTFTLGLGDITPTSVSASGNISAAGTITGSNFSGSSSGTNTGDQTITLTGDVTGSGTSSFATTLSNTGVTANTYGSSTLVPVFTVDSKGRITSVTNTAIAGGGTVTSVTGSGGSTGLTLTGGPITISGTLTLGGTLAIANGGTGATTAQGARNALLPTQTGNSGRFLTTDGTNVSWAVISGTGTVTSVAVTGNNGISVSGSPITTSGTFTLGLGAITPTSVAASGTVTGSNLSGTNTGNQVITLTGDATNSNTSTGGVLTLTTVNGNVGTFGSATQVPVFTVNAKGLVTGVTNTTITAGSNDPEIVVFHYSSGGAGNFTPVDALYSQTAGVSAVITDGANCVATYTFTGKSNPPKSIMTYGQNFTTNVFNNNDTTSLPTGSNNTIIGGGTSAAPDLANGIFSATNVVQLQTRMSDVGASSTIGNRAWCVVVFGF